MDRILNTGVTETTAEAVGGRGRPAASSQMTAAAHYLLHITLLEIDPDYIISGTLTELLWFQMVEECDKFAVKGN